MMIGKITLFFLTLTYAEALLAVEKLIVNGLFQDKAVVTIDGEQRILRKNEPSPEGVVLIEADSEQALIEVDGERQTYTLGTHIGSSFEDANSHKTLTLTPGAGGMYNITGSINGFSVDFVVDTGASLISMNSNVAKRLGIDYRLEGKESVSYTASGKDKIYIINLKRVRIGDIELRNIKGAVHEGNFPVVTLLGMSFLSRLDMKREGRLLELQKKY